LTTPTAADPNARALGVVRIAVAILLGIHGHYRCFTGGAWPFGEYLSASGFPAGTAVAWAITIFEMVASWSLLFGRFVLPACAGFAVILVSGIVMVHGASGWFVVGGGRNGVEFSVLLLACLGAIALPRLASLRR